MKDLLKKRVCIEDITFLLFLYPQFQIISDFKQDIDYTKGVIYKGTISPTVINKLEQYTEGKYIIVSDIGEVVLQKPSDFIKTLLPVLEDKASKYDNYDLEQFIPLLKRYYILQKKPPMLKEEETGIYSLYKALISNKETLYSTYFSLLETMPVKIIVSSILSFLIKVKEQEYTSGSSNYKKLINTAHLKFGNRIKQGIKQYIESKQKEELALLSLLDYLNG